MTTHQPTDRLRPQGPLDAATAATRRGRAGAGSHRITRRSLLRATGAASLAVGAGTALAGCVPGSSPGPGPGGLTVPDDPSGSVTLWMRDDDLLKVFRTVIPKFNQKYPEVDVTMVGVDIATKLPPALISGTGLPDGSFFEDANVGAQIDHLHDLTALMAPHRDDTTQFKLDVLTFDEKLVGIPWDTDPGLLYHRSDVLEDAGVDPAGLTSYDALLQAADDIRSRDDDARPIPLEQDAALGMLWLLMMVSQQQGTGLTDADGGLTIDTPAFRRTLGWIKEVADAGLGARSKFASTGHIAQLDDGTISLVPWAIWFDFLPQSALKETAGLWRAAALPSWEEGGATSGVMGGSSFVIPLKAANPGLAWLFYEFAVYETAGYSTVYGPNDVYPGGLNTSLPSVISALQGEPLFEPVDAFGGQDLWGVATAAALEIPPGYRLPSWYSQATDYLGVNLQKMIDGSMSVEDMISRSSEQIQTNLVDRQR